jgi:predicted membrane protein
MKMKRPYLGPLILIALGVLLLLDKLGIAEFGEIISTYWPIILILVGLRMFFRYGRSHHEAGLSPDATVFSGSTQESTGTTISSSNVFGDVDTKITSKEFRGGSISNTFGDMNVDLAEIQLAEGEQTLKLDGVFGDLHVLVPKDIEIFVTTHSVFGDVRVLGNVKTGFGQQISYSTPNYAGATKKLRIISNQVFGDVKVW